MDELQTMTFKAQALLNLHEQEAGLKAQLIAELAVAQARLAEVTGERDKALAELDEVKKSLLPPMS